MSKRRAVSSREPLSVSKLKRIARPLISKIHVLNDLNAKYPAILNFNFPTEKLPEEVSPGFNGSRRPSQKNSRSGSPSRKRVRISKTSEKDEDISFTDSIDEEPVDSPNDPHNLDIFIRPEKSYKRLLSLKPYISNEVFQAYNEIFQIFRSIIKTVNGEASPPLSRPNVLPKLSTLSAFKMGKFVALSTKSTYYKSNQSVLFDQESISKQLQQSQANLSDEIDHWFSLEPSQIIQGYRINFFYGYLIHLLTFHSNSILYLLVPVIIQWLQEEGESTQNDTLKEASRTLFQEFWMLDSKYIETIGQKTIDILNGQVDSSTKTQMFWVLHRIGYWQEYTSDLKLTSINVTRNHYDSLFLDTLPSNHKLKTDVPISRGTLYDIYSIIRRNPQHPKNNSILACLITQIIWNTRSALTGNNTTGQTLVHFKKSFNELIEFLHVWISFSADTTLVYNSLFPGNERLFEGIFKTCQYISIKVTKILEFIQDYLIDEIEESLYETKEELEVLLLKNDSLLVCIEILRVYFLDLGDSIELGSYTSDEISEIFIGIQAGKVSLEKKASETDHIGTLHNVEFNEFLFWLFDRKEHSLRETAQMCFLKYYEPSVLQKTPALQRVNKSLFETGAEDGTW